MIDRALAGVLSVARQQDVVDRTIIKTLQAVGHSQLRAAAAKLSSGMTGENIIRAQERFHVAHELFLK